MILYEQLSGSFNSQFFTVHCVVLIALAGKQCGSVNPESLFVEQNLLFSFIHTI